MLAVVGVAASLVFVVGSAVLNYRMGFTSATNGVDGVVYGSLAAAGDGLKAVAPFGAAYAWRRRQWLGVLLAGTVFAAFTLYSFTSSLGFSAQHRAHKEGAALSAIESHADRRAEIARARARLDALGPQRGSAEVAQAMANLNAKPVGSGRWTVAQVSDGCTKNKPVTRDDCRTLAALALELLRAGEAERLAADIKALTGRPAGAPALQSADPQTEALAVLGRALSLLPRGNDGHDGGRAGTALAVLMAVFIELGSGLGLYVSTLPLRKRPTDAPRPPSPLPSLPAMPHAPPLEAFAMERLQRMDGNALTVADAFAAYKAWCDVRGVSMVGGTRFERGLLKMMREVGLETRHGMSGWLIVDVGLRRERRRLR